MADLQYFSKEGLEELKAELLKLKTIERPAISRQIAEARDKGDLSENAEYDAAKEAQGLLEMKIAQMETLLSKARVVDASAMDTSKVMILSKVKLMNMKMKQEVTYTLVSEREANLKAGKISVKSPIGSALIGKSRGDIVDVTAPAGVIQFQVLDISF